MVENNTDTLKTECSRFFYCFDKSHEITSEDVEKILTHNREESAFTLFESMADSTKSRQQRFENALAILQKIRLSKDSNATALIAGLTYCFRQLKTWHTIHAGGKSPDEATLKSNKFTSKTMRTRYQNAAKVWSSGEVSSILALLATTDMSIREGGASMEDTKLVMMLYSAIVKNGLFCSNYDKSI